MATVREYEGHMNEIQTQIGALPTESAALEAHGMWQRHGAALLGLWAGMNGYTRLEEACQDFARVLREDLA